VPPYRPVIQIDWDSTINDFDGHYVKTLNALYKTDYKLEDLVHWDWVREHAPEGSVEHMWDVVFHNYGWNMDIPAKTGAVLAVNRLVDAGWDVHIVSARPENHQHFLLDWLVENGITGVHANIRMEKSQYAEDINAWYAVEDSPRATEYLRKVCPVYLIDMPYNQDVPEMEVVQTDVGSYDNRVIRVPSLWVAVEELLNVGK
jgi:5'(3')-deoxyribonucleotidase